MDEENHAKATRTAKTPHAEGVAETDATIADIVKDLSEHERSILIRKAAGFSDSELHEAYRKSVGDLKELVMRVAARVRSLYRPPKDPGEA